MGILFRVHLEPHGHWQAGLDVVAAFDGFERRERPKYADASSKARPEGTSLDEWLANAPKLLSSWAPLHRTYERSIADLAGLRFFPKMLKGALPAAGLPWFMAIFGRDSCITSLQALPFEPELARTTLRVLASWQGTRVDDFRDEEPGKILHELRWGEMTAFEERPHSPYYGAADSTPLFLILLDEYERWTGDSELVRALEPNARAALDWIDDYGDRDGDGYVEYAAGRPETGLDNQCWKDSWNSILFADGTLAKLPRATCEIQGYVYDASVRCARLARDVWNDAALASKLEEQADALKRRFNEDFWLDGSRVLRARARRRQEAGRLAHLQHRAPALERHRRRGQGGRRRGTPDGPTPVLRLGRAHDGRRRRRLQPDRLSRRHGLAARHVDHRLGPPPLRLPSEAARLAFGILEAAQFFDGRLPEAFAGHPRELTEFPVEYPTACSPQAWATGAPLLLLRTLLGLEPVGDQLLVTPAVPKQLARLGLLGIPGRWGRADAFALGKIEFEVPGYTSRPALSGDDAGAMI